MQILKEDMTKSESKKVLDTIIAVISAILAIIITAATIWFSSMIFKMGIIVESEMPSLQENAGCDLGQ